MTSLLTATQTEQHNAPKVPAAPLRVLHVLPNLYGGGMERATLRLMAAHAKNNTEQNNLHQEICILQDGSADLLAQCRQMVPTHILRNQRFAWRTLRRLIIESDAQVVHARSTGIWLDAALACRTLKPTKLLLSFHGKENLTPLSLWARLRNRWALRQADAIMAVSKQAATMMHDEWNADESRIVVLPNGVDTEQFRPAADEMEKHRLRRKLSLCDGDNVVVCVANLMMIKGLDVLIAAWSHVSAVDRKARLLIVGEGPLREELRNLCHCLHCADSVQFLGRREDVADVLRAADLFTLTSRYEGSSNALLEAMATGLPIVATRVGGVAETISDARLGRLLPPNQPKPLADTILELLFDTSERSRMSEAARQEAGARFGLQKWAQRYEHLYRRLAMQHNRSDAGRERSEPCAG